MIFQFLQNRLHLTSTQLHIFFIVFIGLYLALQIINRKKTWFKAEVTDMDGTKYRVDRNTDTWYKLDNKTNIWRDSNGNKIAPDKKNSKPNLIISVVASAILGLESFMLTMAITTFLPETIVGKLTFYGEMGRQFGNTGYQLMLAVSFIGTFALPILVWAEADILDLSGEDRISLTIVAGSILPLYAFIYSIMPLKTDIFFGIAGLSETILLVIGFILEAVFGGRFGLLRGFLEYAVSFALFSSMLTFPSITRYFFAAVGLSVVVAAAVVLLMNVFSSDSGSGVYSGGNSEGEKPYSNDRYYIVENDYNHMTVKSEYGDTYTYYKLSDTWVTPLGISEVPRELEDFSKTVLVNINGLER